MTTLLYRGHAYEQQLAIEGAAQQLRYDRSVFAKRHDALRPTVQLTYRGCHYTTGIGEIQAVKGNFVYRGVSYAR